METPSSNSCWFSQVERVQICKSSPLIEKVSSHSGQVEHLWGCQRAQPFGYRDFLLWAAFSVQPVLGWITEDTKAEGGAKSEGLIFQLRDNSSANLTCQTPLFTSRKQQGKENFYALLFQLVLAVKGGIAKSNPSWHWEHCARNLEEQLCNTEGGAGWPLCECHGLLV